MTLLHFEVQQEVCLFSHTKETRHSATESAPKCCRKNYQNPQNRESEDREVSPQEQAELQMHGETSPQSPIAKSATFFLSYRSMHKKVTWRTFWKGFLNCATYCCLHFRIAFQKHRITKRRPIGAIPSQLSTVRSTASWGTLEAKKVALLEREPLLGAIPLPPTPKKTHSFDESPETCVSGKYFPKNQVAL